MFGKQMALEKFPLVNTVILSLYVLRANQEIHLLDSDRGKKTTEENVQGGTLGLQTITKITLVCLPIPNPDLETRRYWCSSRLMQITSFYLVTAESSAFVLSTRTFLRLIQETGGHSSSTRSLSYWPWVQGALCLRLSSRSKVKTSGENQRVWVLFLIRPLATVRQALHSWASLSPLNQRGLIK